jgi:hypothetical protein
MNKLLELQKALKPIKKDSVNPHFKNSYFDINSILEVVMPVLNDLELTLSQPILADTSGRNVLTTKISDSDKVLLESVIILPDLQDPQKLGSAITYYRRYSLVSLLALEAEDDDGNTASGAVQKQATQDFEAQGLVRFNPPYTKDKDQFKKMTDFLKQNGGRFDGENKCWWVSQELADKIEAKLNNK